MMSLNAKYLFCFCLFFFVGCTQKGNRLRAPYCAYMLNGTGCMSLDADDVLFMAMKTLPREEKTKSKLGALAGAKRVVSPADVQALTFEDFKGMAPDEPALGAYHARVKWSWQVPSYSVQYDIADDGKYQAFSPDISVETYMLTENSWFKGGLSSAEKGKLIRHERVHMEIARLKGFELQEDLRDMRVTLRRKNREANAAVKKRLKKLFEEQVKEKKDRQKEQVQKYSDIYDKETNHSLNKEAQRRYNEAYGM